MAASASGHDQYVTAMAPVAPMTSQVCSTAPADRQLTIYVSGARSSADSRRDRRFAAARCESPGRRGGRGSSRNSSPFRSRADESSFVCVRMKSLLHIHRKTSLGRLCEAPDRAHLAAQASREIVACLEVVLQRSEV